MGKALLGTHATPSSLRLLDEVRALRQRVAELEQALARAEAARDARSAMDAHAPEAPGPEVRAPESFVEADEVVDIEAGREVAPQPAAS